MLAFIKNNNTLILFSSVFLAIVFGIYTPDIFIRISFLGDLLIDLLKLFALPLISSSLITAIGNMRENLNHLKILSKNVVGYMLLSEIIAVTIALILFNLFTPGNSVDPNLITHGNNYSVSNQGSLSLSGFLLSIIPSNIFKSLANFDLLPVVVFSILFGIALARLKDTSVTVLNFFIGVRDASSLCLHAVMRFAFLGIFSLVGAGVAQASQNGSLTKNFTALFAFVIILFVGLLLHGLWQLMLASITSKQSPLKIIKASVGVFSTAFGTSSSLATLPIAMHTAENLNSNHIVNKFMLPLCASINIGGMMMYEVSAALFFSQALGYHLTLSMQLLVALACILGGMAEGGIPETSMVSLVVVFKIVNIPLSAISILLPLDRIIDRVRTMVNIFGNMCGVIIVSFLTKFSKDLE